MSWRGRCPHPDKASFRSRAAADNALMKIRRRRLRDVTGTKPTRVYVCECGAWHMTSSDYGGR